MGALRMVLLVVAMAWSAGATVPAAAQEAVDRVRYDSSAVRLRVPGDSSLARYRDDPAFDYGLSAPREPSWWDRLKRAFFEEVLAPLMAAQDGRLAVWGLRLALAAILAVALLRLLKVDFGGAFQRQPARAAPRQNAELDALPTTEAREALERAEAEGAHRLAVRLRYLLLLRVLDEQGWIEARPEKTNRQYVNEVRASTFHDAFRDLTARFEYVWYGEMTLGADRYDELRSRFAALNAAVSAAARAERKPGAR